MITKEQIVKKFTDFNSEAQDLFSLSFKDKLAGGGVTVSWSKSGDNALKLITNFRGPDDESIKAFCNDLRKFIQRNDSLKIDKLQSYYQSKIISEKEREMFGKEMSKINRFLEANSNHILNGKNYTHKEVLEIFLYGKVVHTTKKEEHKRLENTPIYLVFKNVFIGVLSRYLILINNLVFINNTVIKRLNEN